MRISFQVINLLKPCDIIKHWNWLKVWLIYFSIYSFNNFIEKDQEDYSTRETGTKLNITVSESFLSYDKIRYRKESSPIISPKIPCKNIMPETASINSPMKTTKVISDRAPSRCNYLDLKDELILKAELTDLEVLGILNRFVFTLFLLFIIALNVFALMVYPYLIKIPLTIDDEII